MKKGDLIWAKMRGYPHWPAKIVQPPADAKPPKYKTNLHYVYFFGSNNYAWVPIRNLVLHSDDLIISARKKKSPSFQKAVDALLKEVHNSNHSGTFQVPIKHLEIINLKFRKLEKSSPCSSSLKAEDEYAPQQKIRKLNTAKSSKKVIKYPPNSPIKKIGFIGLEKLEAAVKHLLNTGHLITIWNPAPYSYDDFIRDGAYVGKSPADIIAATDITFCCLSNKALKSILEDSNGVLSGLGRCGSGKGYVELTALDVETSSKNALSVRMMGGRYLEAPILKYRTKEGNLLAVASGDKSLVTECQAYFQDFIKVIFLGPESGLASKINIIMDLYLGAVYNSYQEANNLVVKAGLDMDLFTELVKLKSRINRQIIPLSKEYVCTMDRRKFDPDNPIKDYLEYLRLEVLKTANFSQSMASYE